MEEKRLDDEDLEESLEEIEERAVDESKEIGEGYLEDYEEPDHLKNIKAMLNKIRFKVALLGAKGGVGVSTVTANLALTLAEGFPEEDDSYTHEGDEGERPEIQKPRVGILDLNIIDGPSIARMLGMEDIDIDISEYVIVPPSGPYGIKVVSPDMLLGDPFYPLREVSDEWRIFEETFSRIDWGNIDILLIDLPPGIDRFPDPTRLLPHIDASILVTLPDRESMEIVKRMWRFADNMAMPVIGLVSNMGNIFSGGDIDELEMKYGIPIRMDLPFEPKIANIRGERPYILTHRDSPVSKAFFEFTADLVDYLFWLSDEHYIEEVF